MATTLTVFCAGAVKSAIADLVGVFERASGHRVQFTYGTVGDLQARVMAGERADVLILSRPALEAMASKGKAMADSMVDLGRVGVGVAVRNDAPSPDVSTPEALRKSLLAAKTLTYGDPAKGDSSGIHFAKVLDQLGIAGEAGAKTVLAPVGLAVAEIVAQGEAAIGATQASVICAHRGVKLAGMLPAALQHLTTYSICAAGGTSEPEAAMDFIGHLTTPAARSSLDAAGFGQVS